MILETKDTKFTLLNKLGNGSSDLTKKQQASDNKTLREDGMFFLNEKIVQLPARNDGDTRRTHEPTHCTPVVRARETTQRRTEAQGGSHH